MGVAVFVNQCCLLRAEFVVWMSHKYLTKENPRSPMDTHLLLKSYNSQITCLSWHMACQKRMFKKMKIKKCELLTNTLKLCVHKIQVCLIKEFLKNIWSTYGIRQLLDCYKVKHIYNISIILPLHILISGTSRSD